MKRRLLFASLGLIALAAKAREEVVQRADAAASSGPPAFEAQDLDFFHRVRQGYVTRAAGAPHRFVRIDAGGSPDRVRQAVLAALETHDVTA